MELKDCFIFVRYFSVLNAQIIPLHLDMRSTHKVLVSFIAKRNVEGMLVAFIDVTKTSGMLFIYLHQCGSPASQAS
jgi:hypothetical protein